MGLFNDQKADKVLLMGLAESGKTTIIKVVNEGYSPEKKAPYTATMNYERKKHTVLGEELKIFDLGGQIAFLDRFTGELAEFIFSNVKSLIFVVDIVNVSDLSRVKFYLDLAAAKLAKFSPNSSINVFLHKTDLVKPDMIDKITDQMKGYINTKVDANMNFFATSVFNDSIFNAFGEVMSETATVARDISKVVADFKQNNKDIVDQVQLFTENNIPLFGADFINVVIDKLRKNLEFNLHKITAVQQTVSSSMWETRDKIYVIRFLENKSTLLASYSKQGLLLKKIPLAETITKTIDLGKEIYMKK